ncbi:response regulator [Bacillus sp. A116_S68]|nr:response regulator [Bacillus sp. A116_S68]
MLRIMLVDDEPIEREGLQLILHKNRSNFTVVAEAENGIEAVEMAIIHKPDLIFMDIKMPEVDGLEAIKQIQPELPTAKFIMVSAFDTFDYARRAMTYGIKEYLLKPSKISEVLESFDRMVAEIETEKQNLAEKQEMNHRLERAGSFIEMEFIMSLLMDHVHEFDVEVWNDWIDIENKRGYIAVFSFQFNRVHSSRTEKSQWYRLLKETIQRQCDRCLVGPLTGFQVPVFFFDTANDMVNDEKRQQFVRRIIPSVQSKLIGCHVFAGVGTVVSDITQIGDSYKEAIYALELVHNHPTASYMVYNDKLKQKRTELLPFEIEKDLVEAIKTGDSQKGLHLFETYFNVIQQASDYQVRTIHKAMENFYIVLTRSLQELGFEEDIQISVGQLETSMQIKEAAKVQLIDLITRLREWRAHGIHFLLLQAKDYIDQHYDQVITLEEVANHIGISSYYLSRLFKDKFHVTFIEYVTSVRLQRAKGFLLDGSMSLKEIALNIGYKDPNYFSRVFKKETGLSPTGYRSKYQQ